jgi:hypothetical protein
MRENLNREHCRYEPCARKQVKGKSAKYINKNKNNTDFGHMKQHIKLNNQILQSGRTLCALSVDVESSSISKSSKSAPSVGDSAVCEGCTNPASADNAVAAAAAAAV